MPGLYAQKSGIYKRLSYPYQYGVIKSTEEFLPADYSYNVNDIFYYEGQTRTDIAGKIFHYGQFLKKDNKYEVTIESDGFIDDINLTVENFQAMPLSTPDVVTPAPTPFIVIPVNPTPDVVVPVVPTPVILPTSVLINTLISYDLWAFQNLLSCTKAIVEKLGTVININNDYVELQKDLLDNKSTIDTEIGLSLIQNVRDCILDLILNDSRLHEFNFTTLENFNTKGYDIDCLQKFLEQYSSMLSPAQGWNELDKIQIVQSLNYTTERADIIFGRFSSGSIKDGFTNTLNQSIDLLKAINLKLNTTYNIIDLNSNPIQSNGAIPVSNPVVPITPVPVTPTSTPAPVPIPVTSVIKATKTYYYISGVVYGIKYGKLFEIGTVPDENSIYNLLKSKKLVTVKEYKTNSGLYIVGHSKVDIQKL